MATRKHKSWGRFNFFVYTRPSIHCLYFIYIKRKVSCRDFEWRGIIITTRGHCPLQNAPFRGQNSKVRAENGICRLQHDFMLNNLSLWKKKIAVWPCSGANDATRATNKLYARQKSCDYDQQTCTVNNLIDARAVYLILGVQEGTFNG